VNRARRRAALAGRGDGPSCEDSALESLADRDRRAGFGDCCRSARIVWRSVRVRRRTHVHALPIGATRRRTVAAIGRGDAADGTTVLVRRFHIAVARCHSTVRGVAFLYGQADGM